MMRMRNSIWKKVCVLALGVLMVFGLCACGAEKKQVMKSQTIKRYQDGEVYETQKFEYDEKGRIISCVWERKDEAPFMYEIEWEDKEAEAVGIMLSEEGEEGGYIEIEYDKDGNMISSKTYSMEDVLSEEIECKWEDGVKIRETINRFINGNLYQKNILKYDEYGNLISQKVSMDDDVVVSFKYEFEYDDDGLVEECIQTDRLNDEEIEVEFEYDKEGNLEEVRTGDYSIIKFEYDENKMERKYYYNDELQQESIIEYYE